MATFLGKKLLFVVAHPDDESFSSAGTIWQNHILGGKNYIFCATKGERGKSHLKKPLSTTKLKQVRKSEISAAAKFLKVDGLFFGKFPDTKVKEYSKELTKEVIKLIKRLHPDYILSFGADGISGHLDHIAVGLVAKTVAKKAGLPFVAFAAPPILRKNFELVIARRSQGKYAARLSPAPHNLKIEVDSKIKQKTLSFHQSQAGPGTMNPILNEKLMKSFLNYEYFIIPK
jgi:LmbE family N-acetylglucosaminyl deacetylase